MKADEPMGFSVAAHLGLRGNIWALRKKNFTSKYLQQSWIMVYPKYGHDIF